MNDLQLSDQEKNTCTSLEMIVRNCAIAALDAAGTFERALVLASGIAGLRQAITPATVKRIMPLMNTKLGFLTDKDPKKDGKSTPYSEEVVKECFIEAALMGLSPVGNEFNILFGSAYVTKNGFRRKLKELPEFSDLKLSFKIPKTIEGGAVVSGSATWTYRGLAGSTEREFAVKLQGGMGVDAALGKGERRMLKIIYEQLTGSEMADGAVDDSDAIPTTATKAPVETVTEKLEKIKNGNPESAQKAALIAKLQAMPPQFLARSRGKLNLPELEKLTIPGLEALLKEANNQADAEAAQEAERGF